ncbi:dnaJ homolog subfamily C member 16-like [Arctopsyche grandis]|uniref:dnaJ homolog subfamily C member 16-like n=1 Tax=Arctopsyche grandis TaxID=121162 RepID=UPI00406D817F
MNSLKKNFIPVQVLCRCISSTSSLFTDHYSILGIHRKSTQAEIKAAYYKLSKMYHPDKNKDFEAIKKFRDVNEAYEVLGNINMKKLYDKGVYQGFKSPDRPDTPEERFHKSRANRHKVPMYGKTTIYDFDSWTKEHYSETFQSHLKERETKRQGHQRRQENQKLNEMTFSIFPMLIIVMVILSISLFSKEDYDIVQKKK